MDKVALVGCEDGAWDICGCDLHCLGVIQPMGMRVCALVGMVAQIVTATTTAPPGLYVGPTTARDSTGIG